MYAGQDLLLPLADPSLHTNTSPSQCEMPPFLPLQGLFWAVDSGAYIKHETNINAAARSFLMWRKLLNKERFEVLMSDRCADGILYGAKSGLSCLIASRLTVEARRVFMGVLDGYYFSV